MKRWGIAVGAICGKDRRELAMRRAYNSCVGYGGEGMNPDRISLF